MDTAVRLVNGIGPKSAEFLEAKGIISINDFLNAGPASIVDAPGFSQARAERVYATASELVKNQAESQQTPFDTKKSVTVDETESKQGKGARKSKDKKGKKKKTRKDKNSRKSKKKTKNSNKKK